MKIRRNFVHVLKTFYFIPQNCHYVKYATIRVLSDPYFPVDRQNRLGLYTGKNGSEKTRFLAYFVQCNVTFCNNHMPFFSEELAIR